MYHLQDSCKDTYCNQEYNDDSSDDRYSNSDDILTTDLALRLIVGVQCYHIQLATNSCSLIVTICYPNLQNNLDSNDSLYMFMRSHDHVHEITWSRSWDHMIIFVSTCIAVIAVFKLSTDPLNYTKNVTASWPFWLSSVLTIVMHALPRILKKAR